MTWGELVRGPARMSIGEDGRRGTRVRMPVSRRRARAARRAVPGSVEVQRRERVKMAWVRAEERKRDSKEEGIGHWASGTGEETAGTGANVLRPGKDSRG